MAVIKIHGDMATGATSESNILPVAGGNDKSTVDINAGDNGTVSLSKRDLPADWKTIISEGVTVVLEVDTDAAWDSPNAIRGGGWVNKIDGRVKDLINLQIVGYREYLAARICTPFANGGTDKPKTGVLFEAGTYQGLMGKMIADAFKPVVGSPAQPPTNLGTIYADMSGAGVQRAARLSDAETYASMLDDIRDNLSPNGNEYVAKFRWASAAKDKFLVDWYVGNDTDGKINWAGTNTVITLDSEQFASIDFKLSLSSESMANRVVAQSKKGDDDLNTGADYTVVTEANGLPLFDTFWNPGQELTPAELAAGASSRVKDLKTPKGTASYEVKGELSDWLPKLGSKLTFSGGTSIDTSGYDIVVRCTAISWSAANKKISIDIMLPQARYPKLPSSKSKTDNPLFGGSSNASGGSGSPVTGYTGSNYKPPAFVPFAALEPPFIAPEIVAETVESSRIACGQRHSLAINDEGALYGWGDNGNKQLTSGVTATSTARPTQIGIDTDWRAVYATGQSSYAIKNDNSLWTWGLNPGGKLGTGGDWNVEAVPVRVVEDVRALYSKSEALQGEVFVIKFDGTLWGSGYNLEGALGVGDKVNRTTFTQIGTKTDWVKLEGNTSSNASFQFYGAIDSVGAIYTWGANMNSSPIKISGDIAFKDFSLVGNASVANSPAYYALAITEAGTLYTWGVGCHNESGTPFYREYPEVYSGSITQAHSILYCHSTSPRMPGNQFVVTPDGKLWVFGNGYINAPTTPLQYGEQTGFDWRTPYFIRNNINNIIFIINDGQLWAGGMNSFGELGRGDNISTTPLIYRIGTEIGWKRVMLSTDTYGFSIATLNTDMYGTGYNTSGQLGIENTTSQNSWTIQPSSNPTI